MKKKYLLLPSLLLLLTGCNPYSFETVSYEPGAIFNYEKDSDMVIDGIGDEINYQNLETFEIYEPENQVTLSVKTYFGEDGLYFYCYADDKNVFYNTEFDLFANDGIEMHVCFDPDSTTSLSNMNKDNPINESMIQIRSDVSGRFQTWVGNYLEGNYYEWTQYYKPCEVKVHIDGRANRNDRANGYGVEIYLPYIGFGLTEAPKEVSIMPAFNNSNSNLDADRKWFTYKGMAHNEPSSWIRVNKDGYVYDGKDCLPNLAVTGDRNDPKFLTLDGVELYEVNEHNENEALRAIYKSFFDESGIYMQFTVFDKVLNNFNDSIWANDGVEFYIDTVHDGLTTIYKDGLYRFGFDIDNGLQSDKAFDSFTNTKPYFINKIHQTSITPINTYSDYGYNYLYCYECFIPFESIGVTYAKSLKLYTAFAINSPNEKTYIKDRKDLNGNMESDSWLWVDKHYPRNANEYYEVNRNGLVF